MKIKGTNQKAKYESKGQVWIKFLNSWQKHKNSNCRTSFFRVHKWEFDHTRPTFHPPFRCMYLLWTFADFSNFVATTRKKKGLQNSAYLFPEVLFTIVNSTSVHTMQVSSAVPITVLLEHNHGTYQHVQICHALKYPSGADRALSLRLSVVKPKPNLSKRSIRGRENTFNRQRELKVKSTWLYKARGKKRFASDWLRERREFPGAITKRSKAKPQQSWITFSIQLKIALKY